MVSAMQLPGRPYNQNPDQTPCLRGQALSKLGREQFGFTSKQTQNH
jgi:hypothetical protein